MSEPQLIPPIDEEEPETVEELIEVSGYDEEEFNAKLDQIRRVMEVITGGETVGARVSPILSPKNPRTTSILTRGEIEMCTAFLQFGILSPEETYPAINFVHTKLGLNLSLDGRGIDKAIELGKALTQRDSSRQYIETPGKPTEGMKNK